MLVRSTSVPVRIAMSVAPWMMLAAMTTSCQSASQPDPRPNAAPTPVPEIEVRQNPNPRQRYAITLRFDGLPAAIAQIDGTADFEVQNRDSVPMDYTKAIGGVRLMPQHSVPVTYRRVDDETFEAAFYTDGLLDEDYYGLGVSRWAFRSTTVHFRSAATRFVGGLTVEQLEAGQPVIQHYLTRDFAQKPEPMEVVFGEDENFYQASAGPQFTLTITARREAQ